MAAAQFPPRAACSPTLRILFARVSRMKRGTNPEELVGAAHAGCFSMALSAQLGEVGLKPERIETAATVTLEKVADGFAVTAVHLDVSATLPGADEAKFRAVANKAKEGAAGSL
jgi:osmotically inducible protein OsmC